MEHFKTAHINIKHPPSRAERMDAAPHTKYPFDHTIAAVPPAAAAFDVEPALAVNEAFGAESVNVPSKFDGIGSWVGCEGMRVASDASVVTAGIGIALTTEATFGMVLLSISVISGAPGLRFDCASAI